MMANCVLLAARTLYGTIIQVPAVRPFALSGSILIQFLSQEIPWSPLGKISEPRGRALCELFMDVGVSVCLWLKRTCWLNNKQTVLFWSSSR